LGCGTAGERHGPGEYTENHKRRQNDGAQSLESCFLCHVWFLCLTVVTWSGADSKPIYHTGIERMQSVIHAGMVYVLWIRLASKWVNRAKNSYKGRLAIYPKPSFIG
jgi:hypothetical protein